MPNTVTAGGERLTLPLYDAEVPANPRGAGAVLQDAFGVSGHLEDVYRRLGEAGYRVVVPHLFHRTGDPVLGRTSAWFESYLSAA